MTYQRFILAVVWNRPRLVRSNLGDYEAVVVWEELVTKDVVRRGEE